MRPEDWNTQTQARIEEWLLDPKALVLTIYFRGDHLKADMAFPLVPVFDLTYFLRPPDFVFTVDNFHDEVTFGTFVDSVEENVMNMLELVYAPYFFAVNAWPDSKYLPTYIFIFEVASRLLVSLFG